MEGMAAAWDTRDKADRVGTPLAEAAVGRVEVLGMEPAADRADRAAEVDSMAEDTEADMDRVRKVAGVDIPFAVDIPDTSEPSDTSAEAAEEVVGRVEDTSGVWVSWEAVEGAVERVSLDTLGVSVASVAEGTFGSRSLVAGASGSSGRGMDRAEDTATSTEDTSGSSVSFDSKVEWAEYTSRELDKASVVRKAVCTVPSWQEPCHMTRRFLHPARISHRSVASSLHRPSTSNPYERTSSAPATSVASTPSMDTLCSRNEVSPHRSSSHTRIPRSSSEMSSSKR